ncbi:uncharacterized protein LOC126910981 [Spodoptera frugiperda]|uniref:Uncharacterized protein LOC126910981 n=1 Tax=Spodoptera frugiperda TaxID=7108 RepID=A0A9R0EW99_SPOFR|nr:uncharacterized protein LOC126910981 [Spodoptera frugiperda]
MVFSCFVFLSLYFDLNLFELWCGFLTISYNLNVVYATRVMVLLRMYLDAWIEQIKNIERSGQGDLNIWREMFNVYQNILKAYESYKICFRVLFQYDDTVCSVIIMGWITLDVLVTLTLCVQCEKFYATVEEAESTCIQFLSNINCTDGQKYLCKRVLQMKRTFSKISGCGLFLMDASLSIYLIGLITNYIIVLLQFAYLHNYNKK